MAKAEIGDHRRRTHNLPACGLQLHKEEFPVRLADGDFPGDPGGQDLIGRLASRRRHTMRRRRGITREGLIALEAAHLLL
jgi:hypothetical protein